MQVDIVGRIRNLQLPVTQPLIPLFECLVNSVEAIEDAGVRDGRIDVQFERDARQATLIGGEEHVLASIRDVTIVDNGSGFNDGNVRAFFLSDSTRKANRGNKVIGRFTWLKVFESAAIDSTYLDGETWMQCVFRFVLTTDGVEGEQVSHSASSERRTSVKLSRFRARLGGAKKTDTAIALGSAAVSGCCAHAGGWAQRHGLWGFRLSVRSFYTRGGRPATTCAVCLVVRGHATEQSTAAET